MYYQFFVTHYSKIPKLNIFGKAIFCILMTAFKIFFVYIQQKLVASWVHMKKHSLHSPKRQTVLGANISLGN